MPEVHEFKRDLAESKVNDEDPIWGKTFRKAFPEITSFEVERRVWRQLQGIDFIITLPEGVLPGKPITVDGKWRKRWWPDIALEYWSDERRHRPGWMEKDLECDYIAYLFRTAQTCHFLPFVPLRRVWTENRRAWIDAYPRIPSRNPGYTTVSVAIPTEFLLTAIRDAIGADDPFPVMTVEVSNGPREVDDPRNAAQDPHLGLW